jgi:hypothetical protein
MASVRQKIVAVLVGLVAAVLVMEIALRALGLGFGSSPMEPDPFLHHVHPKNYSFRQQHPSGELGGFDTYYDAAGRVFGGPGSPAPPAGAPCRIALMGDSFIEGGQVPYESSIAGLLDRAARGSCEVRNYGVRSYSPAVYLVQWTREVQPWQPTHVFVLLFGNDVRDDVDYLAAAVKDAGGWPTAIPGPSSGWVFSQLRKSYVARFARMVYLQYEWASEHGGEEQWTIGGVVEENPEWSGQTPALMKELARRVTASGAVLTMMVVPSRYRLIGDGRIKVDRDFYQTVKAWAGEQGVPFLDLHAPFERASKAGVPLFFLQDVHFSSEGHALTAAVIARSAPQFFPHAMEISSRSVQAAFP